MKSKLSKYQIKTDADYYIPIPNDLIGNEILNALNCETEFRNFIVFYLCQTLVISFIELNHVLKGMSRSEGNEER